MPRRNLHGLFFITLLSLVCYEKVPESRCGRVLADAMDRVDRNFYLPVDELNLFEGAMSGMIKGLGDEHSVYIKAAKKQEFEDDLNPQETVQGVSRGADGRWSFLLPDPEYRVPRQRTGYIRITAFAAEEPGATRDTGCPGTAADFRAALERLGNEHFRGLVLDLRDNRGGLLRSAVDVCDMLVPSGEIVTTRCRDGQVLRTYRASGKAAFTGFPIAVLVNHSSASASEIVAGCLQDHDRAIVVGERSYGKGTVQEVYDMGQAFGSLKLTIATYWRPSGKNINRPKEDAKNDVKNDLKSAAWGVSPNEGYEVHVADDERERLLSWQQEHGLAGTRSTGSPGGGKSAAGEEVPDRVLLKAVEYLDEKAEK